MSHDMMDIPERVLIGALTRRHKRKKIRKYVNNWKPTHTNVVYLFLEGKNLDEIRDITGFSSTAVDSILRTPEAEKIKNAVQARVISNGLNTIPEKLAAIQFKAIENISEFLHNPENASNPFAFYDRSVRAAELVNTLTKNTNFEVPASPSNPSTVNNTQINVNVLSAEKQEQVSAGISRALEVASRHQTLLPESVGHLSSLKKDG